MKKLYSKYRSLSSILLISLLISLTTCYTIEGQWQLTVNSLNYTQFNPNVLFVFVNKNIVPALAVLPDVLDGPSTFNSISNNLGSRQLTVYACKTIYYYYYINESSIYFKQTQISGNNRPCLNNEIEEISKKINSTFFFDIVLN